MLSISAQQNNEKEGKFAIKDYDLNTSKIKIKLKAKSIPFQLQEIVVDKLDSVFVPIIGSNHKLNLKTKNSIEKEIEDLIVSSFPKNNSRPLKIRIRDFRILNNLIITDNPNTYFSIDFYIKEKDSKYVLLYNSTEHITLNYNIEKNLERIIKRSIENFSTNFTKQDLINKSIPDVSEQNKGKKIGIYCSIKDFLKDSVYYTNTFDFIEKEESYKLLYSSDHKKIAENITGFKVDEKTYINMKLYNQKPHFKEVFKINKDWLLTMGTFKDEAYANKKSMENGGGLVGHAAGSLQATFLSPALIEKKSGRLIVLTKQRLKDLNLDNISQIESSIIEKDLKTLIPLITQLLSNEKYHKTFMNL